MNREEMLKAACGLFLHEGIRNLSLNKIADRLGVTRHDLHACFGDKRELAELSVEYGLRQLDETLQAAEASSASPVEALIRTSVAVCDAFGQMSWMFSEDAPSYPAVIDAIGQSLAMSMAEYFGLPFTYPGPSQPGVIATESGGPVNLRGEPSVSGQVLARIPSGETVTVFGQYRGWYVVLYDDILGYVSAPYVQI